MSASAKLNSHGTRPVPAIDPMAESMRALYEGGLKYVPAGRIAQLVRQWLPPGPPDQDRAAFALLLAVEVALSMTSLNGSSPFDRMARAEPPTNKLDQQTLAALRQASFRLLRVTGLEWDERWTGLTDVVTGLPVLIEGDDLPPLAVGVTIIARLAPLGAGRHRLAGTPVPLTAQALAIARSFVRTDKKGLTNPARCAEAVFRNIVRHGPVPTPAPPEYELPFRPDSNPIDALAAAWSRLEGDPPPEELEKARGLNNIGNLLDVFVAVAIAEDAHASSLATAYTLIAATMLEAIALRASYGSSIGGLDRAAQELERAIRAGQLPPRTRALFDRLRARIDARPRSARNTASDQELDKLLQRIRALRAKTIEQGCTEQEALAAAEKVAELLDRHGLTVSELDMRRQACEGAGITTDRKRRAPIDDCVPAIGHFFDCRHWGETAPDGTLHYVFFGLPADVQAALYLYDLVVMAFATETALFQVGDFYRTAHSTQRRSATTSFQVGLANGIIRKLAALREARDATLRRGSGRDLVPIKTSIIETELAQLGLNLRHKTITRRTVLSDPYAAGQEAGAKFDYQPGIATAKNPG